MPKIPETLKSEMISVVNKFPKEFCLQANGLYCLLCTKQITFDKKHGKDRVKVHRETKKHQKTSS